MDEVAANCGEKKQDLEHEQVLEWDRDAWRLQIKIFELLRCFSNLLFNPPPICTVDQSLPSTEAHSRDDREIKRYHGSLHVVLSKIFQVVEVMISLSKKYSCIALEPVSSLVDLNHR